jgi:small subunit ribosomal protein S4e
VRKVLLGAKGIPYLVTHDGRTIRYPDPAIKKFDTIKLDLETGKIIEHIKFDTGNLCMVTSGKNMGRVGVIEHRERHDGDYDIVHVKDSAGHTFVTRDANIFVIGQGTKSLVSLPPRKGIKASIIEEQQHFLKKLHKPAKSS